MPFLRSPRSLALAVRRTVAALLGIAALVLALRPPPPAGGHAVATTPVVVAAGDLGPGAALRPADLRTTRFPVPLVPAGAARDPTALAGRVLAAGVRAGEPLTDVRLVGGGLTALLPAGQVAAAVRPADLAVTALVRPGDRVDVLAAGPDGGAAEPVAEGVLVLAVPRAGSGATEAVAGDGPAGLLVVAVDRATAARLAAAATGATLTLTVTPP